MRMIIVIIHSHYYFVFHSRAGYGIIIIYTWGDTNIDVPVVSVFTPSRPPAQAEGRLVSVCVICTHL